MEMIGNTVEYLQANNLILQIMKMIEGKSIFDELKPLEPSDVVNLSLDILRILIQIHCDEDSEESHDRMRTIQDISESSNSFVKFADISIDCQKSFNNDLKDVLLALGNAKDTEELITKILIHGGL